MGFSSSDSEDEEDHERQVNKVEEIVRLEAPRTPPATPPMDEDDEREQRAAKEAVDIALRLRQLTEQPMPMPSLNEINAFEQRKVRELEAERDRLAAKNADLQQQLGAAWVRSSFSLPSSPHRLLFQSKIAVQRNQMASMEAAISGFKHQFELLLPGLETATAVLKKERDRVNGILAVVGEPQAAGE